MREFQERRRIKRFLHSRYAIAVLALVCLVLAKGVWSGFDKYEKSKELAARTNQELSDLEIRKQSLVQGTASLATPEGKEEEMRSRFGVVKEGEKVVVIVDASAPAAGDATSSPKSWWQTFIGFFMRD